MTHSHDVIDWSTWIDRLRGSDELAADAVRRVARRLSRSEIRVVLAALLRPGGRLAVVEGGLGQRYLP